LNVNHFLDFILNDFGISTDFRLVCNMLLQLNKWLIERFREGSAPVLIVDEAQGLSFELLEELCFLLNLETASEKLLQVLLVGQLELEDKLKRPEMRQLRQRIALRCNTASLTLAESHGYIANRLRIAGATREPIFESDAVEALHYYSHGIPRVMNLLCEHALINAYADGLNPVTPQMVEEAARDFLMEEFQPLASRLGMTKRMDSKPWSSVREEAPALPEFGRQQVESESAMHSIAAQPARTAELVATLGRPFAAASSRPGPRQKFWKIASEKSPTLRVSARIRHATRETLATARAVLRYWRLGFIHDWKITVNAMNFHKMKKSLVHWLQRPISSNR
jgi:hypothetical protein